MRHLTIRFIFDFDFLQLFSFFTQFLLRLQHMQQLAKRETLGRSRDFLIQFNAA